MAAGTREALLDAAARLLDAGGVEAVTLREVGRQAGVSHNAPYKHFPSKEALLAALATRELERRADRDDPSSPPADRLRRSLHDYIRWALDSPARFRLIFGPWTVDSSELYQAAHAAHTRFVDTVLAAQQADLLPAGDPVRLAALLRSLAHGAANLASAGHLAANGKGNADPEDLVDDLLAYLHPRG
ncbi:TetR/AcrR family transcriptional regulator [Kutzneria sp. CA-103260]|uniref:TetR/AcrR family transcriptional regulator n=1 Tax=Kutzneria sp. CA-103260 TaxID=2802641 RepID=UPI001BACBD86|nr:TetR/AcrR family transcriptional regulator [Kutzneria sp. CA-103260]QUQ66514.1 TetR family transcriptional regulator [Kutzneria sp. CA-103260]